MKKFLLVFLYEYKRHVLRRRFIFALLSMPLMVGLMVLIGWVSVQLTYKSTPVGYVDPYGLITNPQQVPVEADKTLKPVQVIPYDDVDQAKAALSSGKIQAYFILSNQYMSNGSVTMVTAERAGQNVQDDFADFLRYNLVKNMPQAVVTRLTDGNNLIIRSVDGSREMNADNWVSIILPILSGILFIIAVNISGGYLLQAVVEEKENRTMEIIVTSVSPTQLMAGKIVGDLLVGLTELFIWILFAIIGISLAPQFLPVGQTLDIKPSYILLLAGTFFPAFIMIAAMMGAVGAVATESREAQQVAGIFTIPMVAPFWFITAIMFNPNGALSVGLSLFPLTAPLSLPLRAAFAVVPPWQITLSISLLVVLAIGSLWLAGRVFRIGMLRYGKRISFREIFQRA